MTYKAPLRDMEFVLNELCDLQGVLSLPGLQEAAPETVQAVLEEAAKVAEDGASWQEDKLTRQQWLDLARVLEVGDGH